jgi:hypothetical protein
MEIYFIWLLCMVRGGANDCERLLTGFTFLGFVQKRGNEGRRL